MAQHPPAHPQFTLADGLTSTSTPPHPQYQVCTSSPILSSQLSPPLHVPGQLRSNRAPIQLSVSSKSALPPLFPSQRWHHHPPSSPRPGTQEPSSSPSSPFFQPCSPTPSPRNYSALWPNHTTPSFPNCRLGSAARPLYKLCLCREHTSLSFSARGQPPHLLLWEPSLISPLLGEVTKLIFSKSPDSGLRFLPHCF